MLIGMWHLEPHRVKFPHSDNGKWPTTRVVARLTLVWHWLKVAILAEKLKRMDKFPLRDQRKPRCENSKKIRSIAAIF